MATTVHLPPDLLKRVDQRADELGISRNRYIMGALEKAVHEETSWSPRFLEALSEASTDTDSHEAVAAMMKAITSRRSRKRPPEL
jgi:predicted transcriptional regulator